MKNHENTENQDIYMTSKEELLNGKITFEELRDKLVVLDQLTDSRTAAIDNLKFLYDQEIIDYVKFNIEVFRGYKALLSFTEFHVGQIFARIDKEDALDHFRSALENAQDGSWAAYIEGTILYMEGKIIRSTIISKARVLSKRNADILTNFNLGLAERGHPSYSEDYSKI